MNTKLVLQYLSDIARNNNREWFHANKDAYNRARADFEHGVALAIDRISCFDASVAHLTVRDVTYRFNRDTRFSPDKSPYKRHFGAYIAAHGKKALHGGYYLHIEPGQCMVACGSYWLPTNILTACRNEIMGNEQEWINRVQAPDFVALFGEPLAGDMTGERGFGIEGLKTCPAGFPRDYKYVQYLRMKDYCCWTRVPDDFFEGDDWLDKMAGIMQTAKPMMDFVNAVIDDYE